MENNTLEQARKLAGWLVELGDHDWVSYHGSALEQCKHASRGENIVGLIKAGGIEVIRRVAFILRCRGPFVGTLGPTPRETFPGEVILISRQERAIFYLNGVSLGTGDRHEINEPASVEVGDEEVVFFLAIFTRKA